MSNAYLALILAILVASLVALFFRAQRLWVPIRFILAGMMIASVSAVVFSTESYKGWPSEERITKGRIMAVEIIHPTVNENGSIYLWVYPDEGTPATWLSSFLYRYQHVAPRNYVLPYSKKAARKYARAKDALSNGDLVSIYGDGDAQQLGDEGDEEGSGGQGSGAIGKAKGGSLPKEDTSSGAKADKDADADDYRLKVTPAEDLTRKP